MGSTALPVMSAEREISRRRTIRFGGNWSDFVQSSTTAASPTPSIAARHARGGGSSRRCGSWTSVAVPGSSAWPPPSRCRACGPSISIRSRSPVPRIQTAAIARRTPPGRSSAVRSSIAVHGEARHASMSSTAGACCTTPGAMWIALERALARVASTDSYSSPSTPTRAGSRTPGGS